MVKPKSSYSDKDIEKHVRHIEKYPNCLTWTTQDGLQIPLVLMKDDHLINVISHVEDRIQKIQRLNVPGYIEAQYKILNKLLKERKKRLTRTVAGKVLFG